MDLCKDLDYEDLCRFINEYNYYIQHTMYERIIDLGCEEYPVSVWEFYENEYQDILNGDD